MGRKHVTISWTISYDCFYCTCFKCFGAFPYFYDPFRYCFSIVSISHKKPLTERDLGKINDHLILRIDIRHAIIHKQGYGSGRSVKLAQVY